MNKGRISTHFVCISFAQYCTSCSMPFVPWNVCILLSLNQFHTGFSSYARNYQQPSRYYHHICSVLYCSFAILIRYLTGPGRVFSGFDCSLESGTRQNLGMGCRIFRLFVGISGNRHNPNNVTLSSDEANDLSNIVKHIKTYTGLA